MLRNTMTIGMRQLCGLPHRTFVFFKSPGHNFLTQTLKEFRVVRSKSSALNLSKNVFGRDLQLLNTKRYSSDQSSGSAKRRLPLTARLLLATSGAALIGYYTIHTTRRSGVLAKQRELTEGTVEDSSQGMSTEPHGASESTEEKVTYKIFSDPIHGHIQIHPACIAVIDTPEFQRLRDLKQLGMAYFVYPGAAHNRFEHSLGVCHLAGKFVRRLKNNQPELGITEKDLICLQLAGLCHDLGHGPYSHVFDNKVVPLLFESDPSGTDKKWTHEDASVQIFEKISKTEKVKSTFDRYKLDPKDITFIKELIAGPRQSKQAWPYEGRGEDKAFLYEIVANKRNGIDVDKWDYIARDCHQLGIVNSFDHSRFMKFARVIKGSDGRKQICLRDKELLNLYSLFTSRYLLHKKAYQHKVICGLDIMVAQALVKVKDYLKFDGYTIPDIIKHDNWEAYTLMTDSILHKIRDDKSPELDKAREIINRIFGRDFYTCVFETKPFDPEVLDSAKIPEKESMTKEERIKRAIKELFDEETAKAENESEGDGKEKSIAVKKATVEEDKIKQEIAGTDFFVQIVHLDFGLKKDNPLEKVSVYSKEEPDKARSIKQGEMSKILSHYMFTEQMVRVYITTKKDSTAFKPASEALRQACTRWEKKHIHRKV